MHQNFDKVKHVENVSPVSRLGSVSANWGRLLIFDFLFGFSARKKGQQNLLRKIEGDSWINHKFKKAHEQCVSKLIAQKPDAYDGPLKLPEIDAEDVTEDFFDEWKKADRGPLVIRGFLKGSEILDYASRDSLIQKNGDVPVHAVCDMIEVKEKLGQNVKLAETTLADFLTNPEYEDYYVNNLSGFLNDKDFSEKCRGEEIDRIQGSKNLITQWFISRSNKTGSSLHCAGGDNVFLNIVGKKEWHFIHPSYGSVLQVGVHKNGLYAFSEVHKKINDGYSGLIESNPYLKHVPIFSCVLEEGDILYNPSMWWHSVKNLTSYNVGCATRYNEWSRYSVAIQACNFASIIKNPMKNPVTNAVSLLLNKRKQKQFHIPIYSKKKELTVEE